MNELRNEPSGTPAPARTAVLGLNYNLAGLLCYAPIPLVGLVLPIIFVCTEPKSSKFVRFHAIQSLCLTVIAFVPCFLLGILSMIGLGMVASLLSTAISLAVFVAAIICMIKAWGDEMYRLPVIGDFAFEKA